MNITDIWLQNKFLNPQGAKAIPSPQNPALLAQIQQPMPKQSGDPIGKGASSAMNAAKTSEGGFGRSLLKSIARGAEDFSIAGLRGSNVEQARNLGGMMRTPDEEDALQAQKNAEMEKKQFEMLQFLSKNAERERSVINKEQQLRQTNKYNEDRLRETRRYHDIMAGRPGKSGKSDKLKPEVESIPGLDLSQYAEIKTTKERNEYSSTLKGSNMAYKAIENLRRDVKKLKEMTKGNAFSPTGSTVPFANSVKDFIARAGTNKSVSDEVVLRKSIESQSNRLQPLLEKGLKGSAAGEQLLKRFHDQGVYPDIKQPMNVIEDRLDELLSEVDEARNTAKWSLKTGRHIDALPKSLSKSKGATEPQEADTLNKLEALKLRRQQLLEEGG